MLHPLAAALEVVQEDLGGAERFASSSSGVSSRWLIRQTTVEIVSLTPAPTRWPAAATTRSKLPGRLRKRSWASARWLSSEKADAGEARLLQAGGGRRSRSQPLEFSDNERPTRELPGQREQVAAQERLAAAEVREQDPRRREAPAGLERLRRRQLVGLLEARVAMLAAEVAAVVEAPVHEERRGVDLRRRATPAPASRGRRGPRGTRARRPSSSSRPTSKRGSSASTIAAASRVPSQSFQISPPRRLSSVTRPRSTISSVPSPPASSPASSAASASRAASGSSRQGRPGRRRQMSSCSWPFLSSGDRTHLSRFRSRSFVRGQITIYPLDALSPGRIKSVPSPCQGASRGRGRRLGPIIAHPAEVVGVQPVEDQPLDLPGSVLPHQFPRASTSAPCDSPSFTW